MNRNIRDIALSMIAGAVLAAGLSTAVAANASTVPVPKCPWNAICIPGHKIPPVLGPVSEKRIANFRWKSKVLINSSHSFYVTAKVEATYNPRYFQYGVRVECLQFNRLAGHNRFYWANGIVQTGTYHWSSKTCVRGSRQYAKVWQAQIRIWNGRWNYRRFYADPASGL